MAVNAGVVLAVAEASSVGHARRAAADLARGAGLDATDSGRLALVVTEAATNLLRHAGAGSIVLTWRAGSVDVLALDRGPGMANVARCVEDGFSTAGGAGTGLGALQRQSSVFDVYTGAGRGTALLCRVGTAPRGPRIGAVCVPKAGEDLCGDAWDVELRPGHVTILVVDGLGHGFSASEAADAAVATFRGEPGAAPARRVESIHAALRSTRGAAVAVADMDLGTGTLRYAGLGNIGALVLGDEAIRRPISQNGTAGQAARRIAEFQYPLPAASTLVMHSDGLAGPRDLDTFPGLCERDPGLIAGVLFREFARGRDDTTVVVVRGTP